MKLSHRDYQRVNEAVAAMYRLAYTEGVCAAVTTVLEKTIGGLSNAATLRGNQVLDCALSEPELAAPMHEMTPLIVQFHPRFGATELVGQVVGISDFLSRSTWHRNELHQVARPRLRVEDDLGVRVLLREGRIFCACVTRDTRTFRPEDRAIFSLLLPHLRTLLDPPAAPEGNGPSRLGALGLTRREQEVLYWVSEGKSNVEVAGVLGIAAGTVKRHLENLYAKLGVETRHGAARRAIETLHARG